VLDRLFSRVSVRLDYSSSSATFKLKDFSGRLNKLNKHNSSVSQLVYKDSKEVRLDLEPLSKVVS
jgi:hypothetical protein